MMLLILTPVPLVPALKGRNVIWRILATLNATLVRIVPMLILVSRLLFRFSLLSLISFTKFSNILHMMLQLKQEMVMTLSVSLSIWNFVTRSPIFILADFRRLLGTKNYSITTG